MPKGVSISPLPQTLTWFKIHWTLFTFLVLCPSIMMRFFLNEILHQIFYFFLKMNCDQHIVWYNSELCLVWNGVPFDQWLWNPHSGVRNLSWWLTFWCPLMFASPWPQLCFWRYDLWAIVGWLKTNSRRVRGWGNRGGENPITEKVNCQALGGQKSFSETSGKPS